MTYTKVYWQNLAQEMRALAHRLMTTADSGT